MHSDRETLYRGLSNAAWGYLLLNFDFNLGTVSVTPRFVGWMLFVAAIGDLSGERRDLALLRPLAVLMAVWNGVDWLVSWAGQSVNGHILFLDLLVSAANLYFHFQFLTDMAALAQRYQPEGGSLDRRLFRRRTAYIVLMTAIALVSNLPAGLLDFLEAVQSGLVMGGVVAAVIAALFIMVGLFELRGFFREGESAACK